MKSKQVLSAALLIGAIGSIAAYAYSQQGVQLTVKNVGTEPLQSVVVQATGYSASIGDLGSGRSKSLTVLVRGESHIELEHSAGPRLVVDCYFEPGYRGRIEVDVAAGKVVRRDCQVRVGLL